MQKQPLKLETPKDGYSSYYRLVPPTQNLMQDIGQFARRLMKLPYNLYQTIIGRLVSYLIINPLFRKEEKNELLILQQAKFPDPLFNKSDEMLIINVLPKKNIITRVLINWHNFFINHTTVLKLASSFFNRLINLLPSGQKSVDSYIDKLVTEIEAQVQGSKGDALNPKQIHFRGMEQLSEAHQDRLYQRLQEKLGYNFRQNKDRIYFYSLQTTDNAILDSVEIRPENTTNEDITNQRFIIACMPRSNNFTDWLKHYQIYARESNATIVAFNYRGVNLSKGVITNQDDLYNDAYAQAQRLLQLGAKPENIALMGECLGGNVATRTAGRLHEEGLPVKLYNARSFRSITSIIETSNRPEKNASSWNPLTWLKWVKYGLVKFIVSPIIHTAGWSLNVDKAFLAVPPHDRDYLVVRSKKDEHGKRFADDKMIPHKKASIYSLIKEQRAAILAKKEKGAELSPVENEWVIDSPKAHKFHVSEAQHQNARNANGHTAHPRLLRPTNPPSETDGLDGRQYAIKFFKRVWPTHESKQVAANEQAPSMIPSI